MTFTPYKATTHGGMMVTVLFDVPGPNGRLPVCFGDGNFGTCPRAGLTPVPDTVTVTAEVDWEWAQARAKNLRQIPGLLVSSTFPVTLKAQAVLNAALLAAVDARLAEEGE